MAGTFHNHRKAPHNKCFGVEMEGYLPANPHIPHYRIEDDVFYGDDGSINGRWNETDYELVTQPLDYARVRRTIRKLNKHKAWRTNTYCGTHVHVGRGICSRNRANKIAQALGNLTRSEMKGLFGRSPNHYCKNTGYVGCHCALEDHPDKPTIEFRMFAGGSFEWARECVRRVRILCTMKKPLTYENIKKAFGI